MKDGGLYVSSYNANAPFHQPSLINRESHDHIPQPDGAELKGTILEVAVGQISWTEHFCFQVDISIRIN